ncbi:MAG: phage major tail tube protein [Oscillospiraceae bacterium]|nr:phage major tail tube protein [Oscillospiraceae bacterium]
MDGNAGVINYAIYENGSRYIGIAKVTMPDKDSKTFIVNGAAIAGDIELPVVGQRNAMKLTINFTNVTESAYILAEERVHVVEIRVMYENIDPTTSVLGTSKHKYVAEIIPLKLNGGELAPASPQAVSGEYSVLSLKEYVEDKLVSDVDPFRFRDVDHTGTDRLAEVRSFLGF